MVLLWIVLGFALVLTAALLWVRLDFHLELDARLHATGVLTLRLFFSCLPVRIHFSSQELWARFQKRKKKQRKKPSYQLVRLLLGPIRVRSLTVSGKLGVQDAAQCALLCGGIQALAYSASPLLPWENAPDFRCELVPLFQQSGFHLNLEGIILYRTTQIIIDAIKRSLHKDGGQHVVSASH